MAKKEEIALRKQALVAQMAQSRMVIDQGRSALKEKLNVKNQAVSLVRNKPKAAFAGSALVGLVLTMFLRRPQRSKKQKKKGFKRRLIGWALLLLKPQAKKWAQKSAKTFLLSKVQTWLSKRQPQLTNNTSEIRPLSRPIVYKTQQ